MDMTIIEKENPAREKNCVPLMITALECGLLEHIRSEK